MVSPIFLGGLARPFFSLCSVASTVVALLLGWTVNQFVRCLTRAKQAAFGTRPYRKAPTPDTDAPLARALTMIEMRHTPGASVRLFFVGDPNSSSPNRPNSPYTSPAGIVCLGTF